MLEATSIRKAQLAKPGGGVQMDRGVVTSRDGNARELAERFMEAVAQHRFWDRPDKDSVPA